METKIYLVILASGLSKRFGANKLLATIHNKKIYEYAINLYKDIDVHKKIVVSSYEEILYEFRKYGFIDIYNNEAYKGISTSIKNAVKYIKNDEHDYTSAGIIFTVCDQPLLKKDTINKLIKKYKQNGGIVITRCGDTFGNPVIFDYKFIDELEKLDGDIGGRQVIKNNMDQVSYLDIYDEKEFLDVDTRDDLEKIKFYLDYIN